MMVVFYGCPAFVCQVLEKRRAKVWLDWPEKFATPYDVAKTIELDLDKSPSLGGGLIEVDDTVTAQPGGQPGLTTLGPRWPRSYVDDGAGYEGGVWLAQDVWKKAVASNLLRYPPRENGGAVIGKEVYRWQSLLLPDATSPLSGQRYHGFHARVLAVSGNVVNFRVWPVTAELDREDGSVVVENVDLQSSAYVPQSPIVTEAGSWQPPVVVSAEGPLFLSWELARDRGLVTPKLPLGEGESVQFPEPLSSSAWKHGSTTRTLATRARVADPEPICGTYTFGNPINLSHDSPDAVLRILHTKLHPHLIVRDGRAGLFDALREIEGCESLGDKVKVDLVAHSSSKLRVLVFDGWELRAGDELRRFCEQLGPLRRITQIRLLGCGTGNLTAGCEAMNMLRERLGVEVLGTTTIISSESFSNRQYIEDDTTNQRVCRKPAPYDWTRHRVSGGGQLFDSLKSLPLGAGADKARSQLLRSLEQVLDLSERYVVPGLLLEPLETYRVPLGGGGEAVLCEVLLDRELLRVRAPGDDVGEIFQLRPQLPLAGLFRQSPTLPFRAL